MTYIDLHCDTILRCVEDGAGSFRRRDNAMADLERLAKAGAMAQFFAVFFPPEQELRARFSLGDREYLDACRAVFENSLRDSPELAAPARCAADIKRNFAAGKVSAVLTMEDGRAAEGKLENLEEFYGMGVRCIALTWNGANCFGAPNSDDPAVMNRGLTPFGKDAVVWMQERGMLVDVSHLSDGGFWDVAALCKKPFLATHSNSRSYSPHRRNLTDEMLRTLADRGGAAGLNFAPEFLQADVTRRDASAADTARMARRMADTAGVDALALGTDFDGIGGELELRGAEKMDLLWDALRREGFSEDELEKICWRNALRVIRDAMA